MTPRPESYDIPSEIEDALALFFDDQATPEVCQAIHDWLEADPGHARVFAEYATIERMIGDAQKTEDASAVFALLREAEDQAEVLPPIHIDATGLTKQKYTAALMYVLRHTFTRDRVAALAGVAAVLLVGAVFAVVLLTGPDQGDSTAALRPIPGQPENAPQNDDTMQASPVVATLTAERDAQWAQRPSDDLYAGQRLTLTAGFAEITTKRGAVAILEAPATIELSDHNNALRLHSGKLVGICETDSSKGLLVRTPHMDITDIGTRFGVYAGAEATEVHVFDGEVLAQRPDRLDAEPMKLVKGQSASATRGRPEVFRTTQSLEKIQRFSAVAVNQWPLPATGMGLGVGQPDPNWTVVEMQGQRLDPPMPVDVITAKTYRGPAFESPAVDASQMIGFSIADRPVNNKPYVFETSFDIPDTIAPASTALHLRYMADIHLSWVRINGHRVRLDREANGWSRFEQSVIAQHLVPGNNTIGFEVLGAAPQTKQPLNPGLVGLRLEWSLRTIDAAILEQTEEGR
jgi:hypothetical protein